MLLMDISTTLEKQGDGDMLDAILKGECIEPVYQPIVSLRDGKTYGYEALSRINDIRFDMNIGHLFRAADKAHRAWELEKLCRIKALEGCHHLDKEKKLFLNVNPNIIHDDEFKNGFTRSHLEKYQLNIDNIVFEITERTSIVDNLTFIRSINNYKKQNYLIAIDDVGAGYSGLNVISDVKPNLIKLDMALVRDIDKDEIKYLLCKSLVDFGGSAGIQLIAEGIETEEELETLIKLGVDFGQGYFLGIPRKSFADIAPTKIDMIQNFYTKKYNRNISSSVFPTVGRLAKPGFSFPADVTTEEIYESLRLNPTITEFTVVHRNKAVGLMQRTALNEMLGGRFGFSLHSKKSINEKINKDFLQVSYNMTVDHAARLAMQRPHNRLYDPIVVERDSKYHGIVTIKDLLETCTKIEVDIAGHSNPLTKLPGNLLIEKEIQARIFSDNPHCITYYDIDNFKAYNDAYGFQNGDMMLALTANILKKCAQRNEFIGHIGGDDFIVICDYQEGDVYCQSVIEEFEQQVTTLYHDDDVKNGFIVSKNRSGVTENFPIASLSIAGISSKEKHYSNIDDFSNDIAQLKKKCKQNTGNYYQII
ncbi:MAG: GGDEF domain-containing protein [Defluviitaleaceae bacterium]|nr:GGDEF domain-containing protein [Defluviitaleaceae bacterium]MCL2275571.1 GGDEF domain-containing protein [Defluviitaleaceae bacterium]